MARSIPTAMAITNRRSAARSPIREARSLRLGWTHLPPNSGEAPPGEPGGAGKRTTFCGRARLISGLRWQNIRLPPSPAACLEGGRTRPYTEPRARNFRKGLRSRNKTATQESLPDVPNAQVVNAGAKSPGITRSARTSQSIVATVTRRPPSMAARHRTPARTSRYRCR